LVGSVSVTVPYLDDQVIRYDWKYLLSEQVVPDRMASWRGRVLAADAKKAGNASEITRLTPRPPSLTGKTTWMSWYQKGKTNLDFYEARDSEW